MRRIGLKLRAKGYPKSALHKAFGTLKNGIDICTKKQSKSNRILVSGTSHLECRPGEAFKKSKCVN